VDYVTTRNLLTDSQDFERSAWSLSFATIQNDVAQAPDGTLAADRLKEDANNNIHRVSKTTNVVGSKEYTASAYFKADQRAFAGLYFADGFATFARGFDLSTGATEAISGTSSPTSWTITDVGNGWYRCTITATTNASATTGSWQLRMGSASGTYSYLGDDTSGMYLWGAQLEPGTTATDYVRTVDVVGKAYRWYEPTEGTVFVSVDPYAFSPVMGAYSFDSKYFDVVSYDSGGPKVNSRYGASGSVDAVLSISSSGYILAQSFIEGTPNQRVSTGGSSIVSRTPAAAPPRPSALRLGLATQNGTFQLSGHIRRLTYWPRRLSDVALQDLTK